MERLNCSFPWMKNKTSLELCGSKTYLKDLIQLVQKAYANKSMVNGCNVPNCDNIIWSKATERFKEIDKWNQKETSLNLFFPFSLKVFLNYLPFDKEMVTYHFLVSYLGASYRGILGIYKSRFSRRLWRLSWHVCWSKCSYNL